MKISVFCLCNVNFQIDTEQFQKVLRYIKSGMESNAKLECGGDRLGSKGFFIQPTVFSNVQVMENFTFAYTCSKSV